MQETNPQDIADDDILWGAKEIAKAINRSENEVYHLLSKERLPARKIGSIWVSTRRQLRRALEVA
jgi:hypothetical protein